MSWKAQVKGHHSRDGCSSLDGWFDIGAAEGTRRSTVSRVDKRAEEIVAVAIILQS